MRATRYERSSSLFQHFAERKVVAPVEGYAGLPADTRTGERCPRQGCGGLLCERVVVTEMGACEEVFCVNCARTRAAVVLEPYRPMPVAKDPNMEALCAPTPTGLREEPPGEEEVPVPVEWDGVVGFGED